MWYQLQPERPAPVNPIHPFRLAACGRRSAILPHGPCTLAPTTNSSLPAVFQFFSDSFPGAILTFSWYLELTNSEYQSGRTA